MHAAHLAGLVKLDEPRANLGKAVSEGVTVQTRTATADYGPVAVSAHPIVKGGMKRNALSDHRLTRFPVLLAHAETPRKGGALPSELGFLRERGAGFLRVKFVEVGADGTRIPEREVFSCFVQRITASR